MLILRVYIKSTCNQYYTVKLLTREYIVTIRRSKTGCCYKSEKTTDCCVISKKRKIDECIEQKLRVYLYCSV